MSKPQPPAGGCSTAAAAPAAPAAAAGSRLERLRGQPPRPGRASFFFHDAHFRSDAVKVLPGEYYVDGEDLLIMTTLGSCIAACLWDRHARVGGMNHFMLPDGGSGAGGGRYGSSAMELLIDEMLARGASRMTMEAKVFGGAQVISGMNTMNVGERNTAFVLSYLRTERIPVVSKDVLDVYPRKLCFLPASGKAMVKRLALSHADALLARDSAAAQRATGWTGSGGPVDPPWNSP